MEQLYAIAVFAGTLSFSPGPVNLVIFTSSSQIGARLTMPFVLGATIGFTALLLLLAILVAQFVPLINNVLP